MNGFLAFKMVSACTQLQFQMQFNRSTQSRTLMVASTGNQAMYDHGTLFLRAIMSSLHALSCLPSVKKQKNDFHIIVLFNT